MEGTERRGAEGVDNEALIATMEYISGERAFPSQAEESGECRELPQWGPGGAATENKFASLYCCDYVDW